MVPARTRHLGLGVLIITFSQFITGPVYPADGRAIAEMAQEGAEVPAGTRNLDEVAIAMQPPAAAKALQAAQERLAYRQTLTAQIDEAQRGYDEALSLVRRTRPAKTMDGLTRATLERRGIQASEARKLLSALDSGELAKLGPAERRRLFEDAFPRVIFGSDVENAVLNLQGTPDGVERARSILRKSYETACMDYQTAVSAAYSRGAQAFQHELKLVHPENYVFSAPEYRQATVEYFEQNEKDVLRRLEHDAAIEKSNQELLKWKRDFAGPDGLKPNQISRARTRLRALMKSATVANFHPDSFRANHAMVDHLEKVVAHGQLLRQMPTLATLSDEVEAQRALAGKAAAKTAPGPLADAPRAATAARRTKSVLPNALLPGIPAVGLILLSADAEKASGSDREPSRPKAALGTR